MIIVERMYDMKRKRWIKLIDKDDNSLLRIVYNPYGDKPSKVRDFWIPKENRSRVKAIAIS